MDGLMSTNGMLIKVSRVAPHHAARPCNSAGQGCRSSEVGVQLCGHGAGGTGAGRLMEGPLNVSAALPTGTPVWKKRAISAAVAHAAVLQTLVHRPIRGSSCFPPGRFDKPLQ